MIPKYGCLLLGLLTVCGAAAQHPDDEYYPYAARQEERTPLLLTDSTLFYRAVQTTPDLYAEHTAFNLPYVSVKRRGLNYRDESASVGGVRLSSRYFGAMRLLGADEVRYGGLAAADGTTGGAGGLRLFRFADDYPQASRYAAVSFTDRNYLAGARLSVTEPLGRDWSGTAALDARTGRDMHVEGVFTNALTASLRAAKRFGDDHNLSLTLIVPPSVRGTRLSSAEEAFRLTGDRLYNPAWGFQHGKVRNSRVRREFVPLAVFSYRMPVSQSTSFAADFSAEYGTRKYSALGWYDARTPMPDNYRYLPGYTGDRETEQAWRAGDARYTQIDWAELYRRNRMQPDGEALYALEDRVERPLRMQAAIRIESEVDPQLTVACALRVDYDALRRYKQLRDLLGADRLTDIDHFLLDDATYSNRLQNDLRHPDRTVGEGDRFGYDYRTVRCEVAADGVVRYRSDRWTAAFGASVGRCVVRRRGFYEKELFPGAGSYGGSSRLRFTPYALRASAGYAFSSRSYLEISASASAAVPDVEDLFLQPLYNNRTVDDPSLSRRYGAELVFVRTGGAFELRVTGYLAATRDGIRTTRFFDDLSYEYCDMTVRGIGRLDYGAEAAARLRLTWNWSLSAAVGAGSHTYATNPSVWLYTDAGNELRADGVTSYMSGLRPGGTASLAATAGVHYFGRSGWYFSADASLVAGRWVAPSFHYRTSRVANQASDSPETFALFMEQERLDDSFTADVSAGRMWRLGASRLSVTLSVRNLLDDRRTVYSAYESDRVRRLRSGAETFYRPFATSLLYAYGRSATLTVSYKF